MILKGLKAFAKLEIAITLLLLIAGFSILGTIIEQEQSKDFYLTTYPQVINLFNDSVGSLFISLGFNNIYKSWWFLMLLAMFGTCLISCTLLQQLPILKQARRCTFKINKKQYSNPTYTSRLDNSSLKTVVNQFKSKRYTVFQQKQSVYLYTGILGRFAPIVVHMAMILTLVGTTIAALTTFKAEELIARGEIFQIQNTVNQSFLSHGARTPIRVNDFWIEYGEKQNIKQFYSNLSVLDKRGIEIKNETISVNHPLRYKGSTIYQTDWNAIGLRVEKNGKNFQLPLSQISNSKTLWVSWIPKESTEQEGFILTLRALKGDFEIYKENGEFIGTFGIGDKTPIQGDFIVKDILCETGLQIKADPGIPLIYLGFGILMVSSLISYLAFNQFWLLKDNDKILTRGTSNRAKLNLKLELAKLNRVK